MAARASRKALLTDACVKLVTMGTDVNCSVLAYLTLVYTEGRASTLIFYTTTLTHLTCIPLLLYSNLSMMEWRIFASALHPMLGTTVKMTVADIAVQMQNAY